MERMLTVDIISNKIIGCMHRIEQKKVDHLLLRSIVENKFGNAWDLV